MSTNSRPVRSRWLVEIDASGALVTASIVNYEPKHLGNSVYLVWADSESDAVLRARKVRAVRLAKLTRSERKSQGICTQCGAAPIATPKPGQRPRCRCLACADREVELRKRRARGEYANDRDSPVFLGVNSIPKTMARIKAQTLHKVQYMLSRLTAEKFQSWLTDELSMYEAECAKYKFRLRREQSRWAAQAERRGGAVP